MMLPSSIERIIANGGGVSIDATKYPPQILERFASFAAQSGATIILKNSQGMLPSSMERIAAFGRGKVMFNIE